MECDIPQLDCSSSYNDLLEAMGTQQYWVRFFMRPCCPPPGEDTARNLIEHLKTDIDACGNFSPEERTSLQEAIDSGLDWYLKLGVRRTV